MKTIIRPEKVQSVLNEFHGANAKIWLFDLSLNRLAIRFIFPNTKSVLFIIGISCEYVKGPFSWRNANIIIQKIKVSGADLTQIIDTNSGFELITGGGVTLVVGLIDEFSNSPDDFFKNNAYRDDNQ